MTDDSHKLPRLIGWDGITVRVPEDWSLASVSADEKEGYMRVDGRDMPRLEIKWMVSPGFVDLDQTVDNYLRSVKKGAKADDQQFSVERDVRVVSKRQMQKDGLATFAWRAGQQAYGAAWLCKQCERTVVAQVLGRPDDDKLRDIAQRVISSISDHPNDGWVTWAAYDFVCQIPEDFALTGQQMYPGLIKLSFARDTETIEVGRWGMAETLLNDKPLDDWLQSELGKDLRRHSPGSEETQFRGHHAIAFSGRKMPLLASAKRFIRHILGQPAPDRLVGYAWHCPPQNKIFVLYGLLDIQNYELADQIRDRIECH
jgi:hypothetical protein